MNLISEQGMTDKVQKIREEVERMHNLLPVTDGDNIYLNYADRICTTLERYIDSLQEEPVSKDRLAFKAIPRLLEMLEPNDRAKTYTTRLADALEKEGYITDAKLARESIKVMNGEKVAMATMDEEPVSIDFEKELYKAFGQVKDFTLGMRIAKWFYDMGKNSQEPTSEVWHDMSESVENGRNIIIIDPAGFYGAVLMKGGSQLKNHNKERYVKWAYIDDLQNLSNVQRTAKNSQEPVSEDLEEAVNTYIGYPPEVDECSSVYGKRQAFKAGAKWQKQQDSIPSKDLAELIDTLSKRYPEVSFAKLSRIAVRVAKWKEQHLMANAVEGVVHHFWKCKMASVHYNDPAGVPMAYFTFPEGLSAGDKVKIIVIKED